LTAGYRGRVQTDPGSRRSTRQGWPDLELVTIPEGSFCMGSDEGQPDERPVHAVWLPAFAIAVLPVTNRDFARFVAATGRPAAPMSARPGFDLPLQPVVDVSWFDAVAYCAWLAETTGLPCRLPTEAEREKAALGGADGIRYPWGDAAPAASGLRAGAPPVVGGGVANGYGLFNMGDLVHEWCSDWYANDWYRRAAPRDPRGPETGSRRCSRGGSWRHLVPVTRCAARSSLPPELRYADYGFRVAVGADPR
jgi:formylglycine-generating enzyme required for sulfatase activity